MKTSSRLIIVELVAIAAFAAKANVWKGVTSANMVYTMADYSLPGNWNESEAPNGASAIADFSAMTVGGVFVRIPDSLTLGVAKGSAYAIRPVLVGDGTLVLARGASNPSLQRVQIYSNFGMSVYPRIMELYQVDVCGDFSVYPYYKSTGDVNFRADRYANSSNPIRETPWGSTGSATWYFASNKTIFYAPCGSDEPIEAVWSLKNGSPFAVRAAGTAEHALCAGTIVTVADGVSGAAVPSGTFLKRIFPDGSIELSAAASLSSDSADVRLAFAPFAPRLHQHVYRFRSDGNVTIRLAKYRVDDEFRLEVDEFNMENPRTIGTPSGFQPGTLVLHNVLNTPNAAFTLETAHLEFAQRTDGGTPGYAGAIVFQNATDVMTRFTVTNGISAVVGSFANMPGTVVKDGAGTLTVGIRGDFSGSGRLVVEGGTFAVSNDAGFVQSAVATLAISNGATLKIPESGFKCLSFAAEPGATVDGPGFLVVPDVSAAAGVNFTGGAMAVTPAQLSLPVGGYTYDPPATNVPGNPVMWIDASRPETMTLVSGAEYQGVSRWNDVRGSEYCFLTNNGAHYPMLVTNAAGVARHVYIPQSSFRDGSYSAADIVNTFALSFNTEIKARHIFQVMNAREGGGQFLGKKNMAGYPYSRAAWPSWNDPLFNSGYQDDSVATNIPFFVNGFRREEKKGFAYPGGYKSTSPGDLLPLVSELHPGAISRTIDIDNFGFARYPSRDGRVRMYECIIYTNALTAAEIEKVRGYLMKKWLNSEIEHDRRLGVPGEPLADVADGDVRIFAPDGAALVVEAVSGVGELVKTGGGELYVNDLADASRSVCVASGRMVVRSMAQEMPGNPYFHGDASSGNSVTVNAAGNCITEWRDARGSGHPSATGYHDSEAYDPDARNGNGAIVMGYNGGALRFSNYYHNSAGLSLPECEDVRTVFSVMDTAGGGGFLLGNDDNRPAANKAVPYVVNGKLRGLYRNPTAYSNVIVNKSTYWSDAAKPVDNTSPCFAVALYGPGATRAHVNGVAANLTSTAFSGGWDLVSLASRDPIAVNGITIGYHGAYWYGGGQIVGEHVLYRETLSEESIRRAEAYLRGKWYGVSTPGYRPAVVGALKIDAGATLSVYGGAPVEADSLSGAGTVDGSVTIADGGALLVDITSDGTLVVPTLTGTVSAQGGGTVVLSGAYRALGDGLHALAAASGDWSGWTAAFADGERHSRELTISVSGGTLVLGVRKSGSILVVW